jgi:glycosyltransferase involved in cell wall biosynthesis
VRKRIPGWRSGPHRSDTYRSVRILPELRAVQVERDSQMFPARTIFLGEKYDLGETIVPQSMSRLSLPKAVIDLFWAKETVLELPEPLWLRFLPRAVVLSLAWRIGGRVRRRRRETVTYAIENNTLDGVLFGKRRPQPLIGWLVKRGLRVFVALSFDRIAFGSAGARNSYNALGTGTSVETKTWEELPTAGTTPRPSGAAGRAIFVGRLEERKGIRQLLAAWAEVEHDLPSAMLSIVGGGELQDVVEAWSRDRPESRTWVGEVEHEVVASLMLAHDVVVAPSIRWGRWREQIGLPIGEGLQAGLTVVTTDETGLADWLGEHGHRVCAVADVSQQLAPALHEALSQPIPADAVRSSLPEVPGRIAADHWLHSPRTIDPNHAVTTATELTGGQK